MLMTAVFKLTQAVDSGGPSFLQITGFEHSKPAIGVDRGAITHHTMPLHVLRHISHLHLTVRDVAEISQQSHAVQRLEQQLVEFVYDVEGEGGEEVDPR